jgi:hypothetical protein
MNSSMVTMMGAIVRWTMRIISVAMVAAVMVLAVVIVIVIPDVNSIAAVLIAPFDLCLEMRPLAVLITFDCVVRVASPVAEIPSVRVGNASVSRDFM